MRRRRVLPLLAALMVSAAARPQSTTRRARVAVLESGHAQTRSASWAAFAARLKELGYAEGANLELLVRFADGDDDRLAPLASELVALKPDVIVTAGSAGTRAAMLATSRIPIVFNGSGDPVRAGLVTALGRPTGNVTGLSAMYSAVAPKWVELLRELRPGLRRIAILGPAANTGFITVFQEFRSAARVHGMSARLLDVETADDIEYAFREMAEDKVEGFAVAGTQDLLPHARRIVELAARQRLPAVYARSEYVDAGGLLWYGADTSAMPRRSAEIVHRILLGAVPADFPIEQLTTFKLRINRRTARALGLTLPQSLLVRADEVIE